MVGPLFNGIVPVYLCSMCGRYTITQDLAGLEKIIRFICQGAIPEGPRYNLDPRQQAPVLVWENGTATLKPMRWGLIPSWAKDETIGDSLTNGRVQSMLCNSSLDNFFSEVLMLFHLTRSARHGNLQSSPLPTLKRNVLDDAELKPTPADGYRVPSCVAVVAAVRLQLPVRHRLVAATGSHPGKSRRFYLIFNGNSGKNALIISLDALYFSISMERPMTNGKPTWPTLAGRLNQPPATRAEAVRQLQTMIPITPLAQSVLKSSNSGSSNGPKKTGN